MYGERGLGVASLEVLTIVQVAAKVGKDEGYTEEELPQKTLEEIFSGASGEE